MGRKTICAGTSRSKRRAGIRTVIVSYGFRSEDELAASGIKSMAGSAYKLDEILESIL